MSCRFVRGQIDMNDIDKIREVKQLKNASSTTPEQICRTYAINSLVIVGKFYSVLSEVEIAYM